ncbi:Protocadherin alpha-8 [Takifugu flavidus]|uniref:Protocadherin alpha-8 n=1 Tax=Takifugu flavidus TaxID=433684 RepID=A0A5C6ML27_9TELE|nr:Protocadherin alpha-8 [Takifugu flavidus]
MAITGLMRVWIHFCLIVILLEGISAQIRYSLQEELKVGTAVGNIAKDLGLDLGRLAERNLRVLSGTKQDLFKVNPSDGVLSVNRRVDREELCAKMALVEDVNDNPPEIEITSLSSRIPEDAPPGTVVALMGVTDQDSGMNGQVVCSVPTHLPFDLKPSPDGHSYSLVTKEYLDKENSGSPSLSSNVTVNVFILDQNDNAPVILYPVSSNGSAEGVEEIPRNVNAGHLVTKVRAYDADIGYNGWLLFSLQQVSDHSLFGLDRYTGQIRTLRSFTETDEAEHKLVILVKDNGNVSLSATATVMVKLVEPKEAFAASDLQSSAKDDEDSHVTFYLIITLGSVSVLFIISIIVLIAMQCSKSPDYTSKYLPETNYDGTLCHSIQYRSGDKRYMLVGPRMSIGSTIVPGSHANTLVLPDRRRNNEELRYSLPEEIQVGHPVGNVAKDLGLDISSLAARRFRIVPGPNHHLFQLNHNNGMLSVGKKIDREELCDGTKNDNAPVILYPVSSNGSAEGVEEIPRNVNAGHLVTKVRAYDADIGYNGWLLFSLQQVSDHSLFGLDRYTGQIRTLRSFTETDEAEHKLVILVKDNGNVSLSATATVMVKLVEPKEAFAASDLQSSAKDDEDSHVTFYLMITLGSVSVLFIISIIVLIAMQCSKSPDYTSKYLPETNYDGTLCHSIQYRSGDKRYICVDWLSAQVKYSVPEEVKVGSVVGNVAKDLGLDISTLEERRFRIVSGTKEVDFEVNQNNGVLSVRKNLDREGLCETVVPCLMNLKIVAENPMEIHYVTVEIIDVNDNSPTFQEDEKILEISESTVPGKRFQLPSAHDPDVSANTLRVYRLNQNEYFNIQIRERAEDRIPFLVLQRSLDREKLREHHLILTAVDGGNPPRSGTLNVTVIVLDSNDNHPIFSQEVYSADIPENVAAGTSVINVKATDLDEGANGEIEYLFGGQLDRKIYDIFDLNKETGEIKVKGEIDFEKVEIFKLDVHATDKGQPPMSTDCTVIIKVLDQNDNTPQIEVTSLSTRVSEDSKSGTVISLISIADRDAGLNDVNDNAPEYSQNPIELYLVENNVPGNQIFSVTASDKDLNENAAFQVVASDSGSPSLSSNVTVNVFILDQNDNAPVILYPVSSNGSAEGVEEIPRNVNAGHLVTKVRAYDADIGYNGWLLFSLQQVSDHSLFGLDRYTGQIRTLRSFTETDEAEHKLVILVKDNGNVSLSATATVMVKLVEPKEAFAASDLQSSAKDDEDSHVTFYLIITLGSVSVLFIISIIVLIAMQCSKSPDYTSKYLPETNYDGTLCHSIQYRSGDKRYMLVGPRMSIGSTIVPGSHANTLVLPDRRRNNEERAWADLRYSVPEEMKESTVVGNVAKDLGLEKSSLADRRFRVVSGSKDGFFEVNPDNGALQIRRKIDREETCQGSGACLMELKIVVENPLEMHHIVVEITDVNDHSPRFSEKEQRFQIAEQTSPGTRFKLQAARDPDSGVNAIRTYTLSSNDHFDLGTSQDSGSPSLSSNVTVNVFILDQNDNAPVILYPVSSNGSAEGVEEIPRNVNAGHLVTKVRAYDADIGYNGWLLFSLQQVSDHSLFGLDRYTGQIRTLRSFTETDEAEHKLVILVKDNGNVSLSATATVMVKLVEPKEAFAASDLQSSAKDDEDSHVTFYLMITLGSVSVLFIISIIVLIAMQCSKSPDYTSKYLPETNYDGTLCHSIQYRSGDKRYMLVGPRMSIGSTIVPGSHANTLVLPDRRRNNEETSFVDVVPSVHTTKYKGKGAQHTFAQIKYSTAEEVKLGTTVGNVAKDLGLDVSNLMSRRFRIVSGGQEALFEVNPNNGALYVHKNLDRELLCDTNSVCVIDLKIVVENPLEIHYVAVEITDANDHAPAFIEKEKIIEIAENTLQGARFQLPGARDPDIAINSVQRYKLSHNENFHLEIRERGEDKIPFLVLQRNLDREQKMNHSLILTAVDGGTPQKSANLNITFQVVASDSGSPSLSSNVTVKVFILDQNDNAPVILYPVSSNGSAEGVEEIPRNVNAGHLVTKVRAYDADIGYNGWLLFSLQQVSDHSLFGLDRYTGQIRTLRSFTETDEAEHKLVILVKDNGNVSLSATATVMVKLVEPKEAFAASDLQVLQRTMRTVT